MALLWHHPRPGTVIFGTAVNFILERLPLASSLSPGLAFPWHLQLHYRLVSDVLKRSPSGLCVMSSSVHQKRRQAKKRLPLHSAYDSQIWRSWPELCFSWTPWWFSVLFVAIQMIVALGDWTGHFLLKSLNLYSSTRETIVFDLSMVAEIIVILQCCVWLE